MVTAHRHSAIARREDSSNREGVWENAEHTVRYQIQRHVPHFMHVTAKRARQCDHVVVIGSTRQTP